MRLLKYDLSILYIPEKEMHIVDTLSGDLNPEIKLEVCELVESLAMSKKNKNLVKYDAVATVCSTFDRQSWNSIS
ncbi:Uncharacterized protein FWK35_00029091 [Aphis craccivora]|uniref:Uncharacterized protein n=1 Tax=Aphis craccivora TaxID=307492 RepID=A0A6G0W0W8_APHCR|nr:Uncharacterized protein FWK35_00029091 [Aphis craccivora]